MTEEFQKLIMRERQNKRREREIERMTEKEDKERDRQLRFLTDCKFLTHERTERMAHKENHS